MYAAVCFKLESSNLPADISTYPYIIGNFPFSENLTADRVIGTIKKEPEADAPLVPVNPVIPSIYGSFA
ncbi:hypothetical protein DVH26_34475 [Paenibacillus sp. H1-7]|nr:hypothetical protein DVH26_34475 [Paenibacillus sp. H1-7]